MCIPFRNIIKGKNVYGYDLTNKKNGFDEFLVWIQQHIIRFEIALFRYLKMNEIIKYFCRQARKPDKELETETDLSDISESSTSLIPLASTNNEWNFLLILYSYLM